MPNWCSTDYQIVGKQQNVENLFKGLQQVLSTDRSDKREIHFCLTLRGSDMSLATFWTLTLKKNAFHAGVALVI